MGGKNLTSKRLFCKKHSNLKFCCKRVICTSYIAVGFVAGTWCLPRGFSQECGNQTAYYNHIANPQTVDWNGSVLSPLKRVRGFLFSRCGSKERMGSSEGGIEQPWKPRRKASPRGRWQRCPRRETVPWAGVQAVEAQ